MPNNRQVYLQAYYQKRKAELNARKRVLRQRKKVETLTVETSQTKMSQLQPKLTHLIHLYQTNTNYSCVPSCSTIDTSRITNSLIINLISIPRSSLKKTMPKSQKCHQCRESNLKLTKAWNNQYYCADCTNWNEEAEQSGIAACYRYTSLDCENCAECASCRRRKKLEKIPTRDLLIEVLNRQDYQALITWEDDGFQQRIQEIVWELKISKGMTPKQIQAKVNKDIRKKFSQRKYSRGV